MPREAFVFRESSKYALFGETDPGTKSKPPVSNVEEVLLFVVW